MQSFENGHMLWREDLGQIYVMADGGRWDVYEDTWSEGDPWQQALPPEGLFQPVRGFGKIWDEQLGGAKSALGWATKEESGTVLLLQEFSGGRIVQSLVDGLLWVLYQDFAWTTVGQ
jgi:hypothetical protein